MATAYRQYRFSRPRGATEVFLVRHGESAPIVPGEPIAQVDGQDDPPLAPEGREQAQRVAERLADQAIDAIYVSSLRRTHQTAEPLARLLGLTPTVDADLREVYLGEWEHGGLRRHSVDGHPLVATLFAEQRWEVLPGAESSQAFAGRLRGALSRIAAAHPDQRVVVVAHGGVIGELVRLAAGGTRGFAFLGADNGSISHLVLQADSWVIRRFNDTAHLGGFDLEPGPSIPQS